MLFDSRSGDPFAARWVAFTLAAPTTFHALWNLSSEGQLWWQQSSGLPPTLRFLIGGAELCAAIGLVTGIASRAAALGLLVIFTGAIPQHFHAGYSFKNGGWEVLSVYWLLALFLTLRPTPRWTRRTIQGEDR